jgi:hypothetical protein
MRCADSLSGGGEGTGSRRAIAAAAAAAKTTTSAFFRQSAGIIFAGRASDVTERDVIASFRRSVQCI